MLLIIASLVGLAAYMILGNRPAQPKEFTLTVWGFEDEALFEKTYAGFKAKYPLVSISYKKQRLTKYRERLNAPADAATNEARPDIFVFHNTWTPMLANQLTPLPNTVLLPSQYETLFYPATKKDLKRGDDYVGMPLSADGLAMYVNTEMLKAKNVPIPTQWEELLQAATILSVYSTPDGRGNKILELAGAGIGTPKNVEYFSDIIGMMLLQVNLDLSKIVADAEAGATVEYYSRFAQGKEAVWSSSFENSIESFTKGKVAIIFAPASRAGAIKAKNPALAFTTAPMPQLKPDEPIAWASYWAWGVSPATPNPTLAWELVWSLSSKASLVRANQRRVATTKVGLPYPRVDMADRQKNDPILGAYITQAPYAYSQPLANGTRDNGLNDKLIAELAIVVTRVNNGSLGKIALKDMADKVTPLLEENGYKVATPN